MNNAKVNNAMVLAAGLGTRMRPITDSIPKPLVSVDGKVLLDYALDALENAGVEQAAINVHYFPDQIEHHVSNRLKPQIHISDERKKLLDSGGGVKKAIRSFQHGPVFILNADSFWIDRSENNLSKMNAVWNEDDMDMLLLVSSKENAIGFNGNGDFFMDEQGRLTRRGDADSAPAVYAGAIIAKKQAFDEIVDEKFSLNRMFDEAIAKGRLYGTSLDGLWLHVGTPDAIMKAEQAILLYKKRKL